MTFWCDGCARNVDFSDFKMMILSPKHDKVTRLCRGCRSGTTSKVVDVYFDGKPEENLADDPRTGKPRVFSSKGEKAAYLKFKGLMECGDSVHGAPVQLAPNQERKAVDSRHEVQMALKRVREMGRDVRHQEYLRITKEGQRRRV